MNKTSSQLSALSFQLCLVGSLVAALGSPCTTSRAAEAETPTIGAQIDAQLSALDTRHSTLDQKLSALRSRLSTLDQQLAELRGDAGLVYNDRTAARANVAWLNAELAAQRTPILRGTGDLFIDGTIETPATVGGRLMCTGGTGYPIDAHPSFDGNRLRIVQLGKVPSLRLRGTGFVITDPLDWLGNGETPIWEIEGRKNPATGRHAFMFQRWRNSPAAVVCLGGYFDAAGKFIVDENHADNCTFDVCEATNCDRVLWLRNEQSVNHHLRVLRVNRLGRSPVCVADCERGGNVTIDNLTCCNPHVTIFRGRDFSPHTNRLVCRGLEFDRPGNLNDVRLVPFEYSGDVAAASWCYWLVDVEGFVTLNLVPEIVGPPALPRSLMRVELTSLYAPPKGDKRKPGQLLERADVVLELKK